MPGANNIQDDYFLCFHIITPLFPLITPPRLPGIFLVWLIFLRMPNTRGAPKGNLNALKHGYYSRLFHASEADDLDGDDTSSLQHEITLLRVMIRRTMALADGIDDLKEATRALDALGAAAGRLANLMRADKTLNTPRSELADEMSIAIQQVNQELRSK
jgi:hypothetical protein